jgi:phosphoribosylformylglycinamidine synthase
MPERPPRLDRVDEGMDLWLIGPGSAINLAGSAFERVTFGHVGGRPSAPDRTMAVAAIEMATRAATELGVPVLHDISDGGLAVAVSEIAIAGTVGAKVGFTDWRHLFSEDPHRFLAAAPESMRSDIVALAAEVGIPSTRIGVFGGEDITFEHGGIRAAVSLEVATETFRRAIPRRME